MFSITIPVMLSPAQEPVIDVDRHQDGEHFQRFDHNAGEICVREGERDRPHGDPDWQ